MLSFLDPIMSFSSFQICPIRDLQELCQSHSWDLNFVTTEKGKKYTVEAKVNGSNVSESASATSLNKKDAARIAAQQIFPKLKVKLCGLRSFPFLRLSSVSISLCIYLFLFIHAKIYVYVCVYTHTNVLYVSITHTHIYCNIYIYIYICIIYMYMLLCQSYGSLVLPFVQVSIALIQYIGFALIKFIMR